MENLLLGCSSSSLPLLFKGSYVLSYMTVPGLNLKPWLFVMTLSKIISVPKSSRFRFCSELLQNTWTESAGFHVNPACGCSSQIQAAPRGCKCPIWEQDASLASRYLLCSGYTMCVSHGGFCAHAESTCTGRRMQVQRRKPLASIPPLRAAQQLVR